MSRENRGFLPLVVVAALASAATAPLPAQAAATCVLHLRSGSQVCYAASRMAQAEKRVPFTVIRPTAAIASVTQLQLSQVSVIARQNRRVMQVAYIYGAVRRGLDLSALPGRSAPRYVLVQEIRGAEVPLHPRTFGTSGTAPWHFTAVRLMPSGARLSLIVASNLSRATVQTIGRRLLKESALGR